MHYPIMLWDQAKNIIALSISEVTRYYSFSLGILPPVFQADPLIFPVLLMTALLRL